MPEGQPEIVRCPGHRPAVNALGPRTSRLRPEDSRLTLRPPWDRLFSAVPRVAERSSTPPLGLPSAAPRLPAPSLLHHGGAGKTPGCDPPPGYPPSTHDCYECSGIFPGDGSKFRGSFDLPSALRLISDGRSGHSRPPGPPSSPSIRDSPAVPAPWGYGRAPIPIDLLWPPSIPTGKSTWAGGFTLLWSAFSDLPILTPSVVPILNL